MKKRVLSVLLSMVLLFTSADFTVFATGQTTEAEIMSEEGTNSSSKEESEEELQVSEVNTVASEEDGISTDSIEGTTEGETGKTIVTEENSEGTETIVENSDIEETFSTEMCGDSTTEPKSEATETELIEIQEGKDLLSSEKASGKCGDNLTWKIEDATLIISGTGNMYSYNEDDNPWNKYKSDLKQLIIEDGVTSIGYNAFDGFNGFVGDLVIPDSITSIGWYAFRDCSGFTGNLVVPNSVTYLGIGAFSGCSGFDGCLKISENIDRVTRVSFENCSGFTGDLIIPNGVEGISYGAFSGCSGFNGKLTIPNSVKGIDSWAFENCSGFTGDLTIPNSVTHVGYETFKNCYGFTGNLILPSSNFNTDDYAFKNCYGFTGNLILPSNMTKIGNGVFNGCSGFMGDLIIPNNVSTIGEYAFGGCSSFVGDLIISNSVIEIESGAFSGCSGFTGDLIIPDSVTILGEYAFNGCSGFAGDLIIPNSVVEIGNGAFSGCSGFKGDLKIPSSIAKIEDSTFANCSGFNGKLIIPRSVTSIGTNAFINCNGFTGRLILSDNIVSINNGAFSGCSGFTGKLSIPSSITTLGTGSATKGVFENCSGFTGDLTIPDSVTKIGANAFKDCSGFTGDLFISDNVTEIGNNAFNNCSGFGEKLIIGTNVKYIGFYAFADCDGISQISFKGELPTQPNTNYPLDSKTFNNITAKIYYPDYFESWKHKPDLEGKFIWMDYSEGQRPWEMDSKDNVPQIWTSFNINPSNISYNIESGYSTKEFKLNISALYMQIDNEISSNYENVKMTLELPQGLSLSNDEGNNTITSVVGTMDSTNSKWDSSYQLYITADSYIENILITATITADNCEMPQVYSFSIPVSKDYRILAFDASEYRVYTGERVMIAARVINYDNFNENEVKWISSDENMVSVTPSSCGSLGDTTYFWATVYNSGKSLGKAKITVTIPDGRSASCVVNALGNKPTQVTPSYQVHKRHETNELLQYYGDNWEEKYNEYVEAVKKSLKKYASSDEGKRAEAISNLAGKMKQNDNKSNSKYLSFSADFPNSWKNNAYTTLATYLCDNTCSKMDFDSKVSERNLVNTVLKSIVSTSEEYKFGNVVMSVSAFQFSGTKTGSMTCYDSTKPSRKYTAVICSTKSECEAAIRDYYNQLYDLEETALYNIYTAVGQDILGKPLSTFTEKWLKSHLSKYINRLNASGIGDLYDSLRKCYEYYQFVNNISNGNVDAAGKMLDSVSKIKIDDTTITDRVVKKAVRKLDKAGQELNKAYIDYINGELKENGLQRFWRVTFGCPVSVSVWNSDGEQIGYVGSDDIWYIDTISIEESGNAVIIDSYIDEKLSFTITGTDYGIMGCSIEEYDLGNIPLCRANFYDIALEPDIELSLNLTKSLAEDLESISMESSDGQYFSVDEYIPVDQDGAVTVNCVVEADENIGNDSVSGSGTYVKGDVVVLTAFPQTDHRFIGWFNGEELITTSRVYEFIAKESMDLKALFKQEELSKLSMPNSNYETGLVRKGTQVTLTSDEDVAIYYTTDGTDPTADSNLYSEAITINEDTVLKAIAVKEGYLSSDVVVFNYTVVKEYTVTFNSFGGSYVEPQIINEGESATEPLIPTKEGYSFTGWFLDGVLYTFNIPVTSDITLYAGWSEVGTVTIPSPSIPSGSTVKSGTKLELISDKGAKIYYTLDGTEPTERSTLYTEPIIIISDVTIKAFAVKEGLKNSEIKTFSYTIFTGYTVTFNSNGGTFVEPQDVSINGKATEPLPPIKEGYTFLGWYLDGILYDFDTIVTSDITLEAKWVEEGKTASPTSNIASGRKVKSGTKIKLISYGNANIYYTLDETIPTRSSILFVEDITVTKHTVIKAFAVKDGLKDSDVATFIYDIFEETENTGDVLIDDIPESGIPNGLWIAGVNDTTYTGKAIIPTVRVYDYTTRLIEKQDYTISYKNNVNANDATNESKAPGVVVKAKGNYSGKETATFKILAKDINSAGFDVVDIASAPSGKVQNPVPVLTYNGKKLSNKKNFKVEYPDKKAGAYKDKGTYTIKIIGTGNYTGERTINFTITDSNLISKAKISKISNQPYTGRELTPSVEVKYGKNILKAGTDYEVEYRNNIDIGTGSLVIKGKGSYVGQKSVPFKITGQSINKAVVNGLDTSIYTGDAIIKSCSLSFMMNGSQKTLEQGKDYTISFQNNTNAGKATVIFTGINGYSGVLKKTFKIEAYDIGADTNKKLKINKNLSVPYCKNGSTPDPVITFGGKKLVSGRDYSLSYKKNKALSNGCAEIIVKGKGNFKGTMSIPFIITTQKLENLNLILADKPYKNKAKIYATSIKLLDINGKALSAGKDYDKSSITYTYAGAVVLESGEKKKAGDSVSDTDIIPANTQIQVTVNAKAGSYYTGTVKGIYRIIKSDIKSAKVSIPNKIYTGSAIVPAKSDITVTVGGNKLTASEFEIVSCTNNIKKGKASITIRGMGNYGGTKTVKFTIKSKGFTWWWRK